MQPKTKLTIIISIVIAGFVCSVLFHFLLAHCFGLNRYPYNTFLFYAEDRFNDFLNTYRAVKGLDPYGLSLSVYSPFTLVIMYLLTFLSPWLALLVFSISFILFFWFYLYKNLPQNSIFTKTLQVFTLSCLTYPFLITLDRGNVEAWVFICLALFIYFYQKQKEWPAILTLSLAIALKTYPVVFLVLFLADKKVKPFLVTILITLLISIISFAPFAGSMLHSFNEFQTCFKEFNQAYVCPGEAGMHHSLNLLNMGRVAIYTLLYPTPFIGLRPMLFELFASTYPYFCLLLFALISLFIVFKEKTFWKQVLLLIAAMVLFPQVSGGYKLIHFFIPMLLFINTEEPLSKTANWFYAICFALLLIPKNYYVFKTYPVIDISIVLNPLIISIMCLAIIRQGLKKKKQTQT